MSESLLNSGGSSEPAPTPVSAPAPVAAPTLNGEVVTSWRDSLPDDLKSDPGLAPIQDVNALAKSFIHAQKMIGKDKIVVPDKHATPDDWKGVFKKLGLPEADKYELKTEGFDKDFIDKFKGAAYEHNILPHQAESLLGFYKNFSEEVMTKNAEREQQELDQQVAGLKNEWGQAFDKNLKIAHGALKQFADPETFDYIVNSGLGNDTKLVKLFHQMGMKMGEDQFVGEAKKQGGLTPADAQVKVNEIMGNRTHPYWDAKHPNHKNAVNEVFGLHEYIAESEKALTQK